MELDNSTHILYCKIYGLDPEEEIIQIPPNQNLVREREEVSDYARERILTCSAITSIVSGIFGAVGYAVCIGTAVGLSLRNPIVLNLGDYLALTTSFGVGVVSTSIAICSMPVALKVTDLWFR